MTTPDGQVIAPPPSPKVVDFPGLSGVGAMICFVAVLLVSTKHFDPSGGEYTIALIVVLTFVGTVVFCLFFSVPHDDVTASVLGALSSAFGGVIGLYIGRKRGN